MGYMRHHAILVTHWEAARIERAYLKAVEIFGDMVSPLVKSESNGIQTFVIVPDGSKEGWDPSEVGNDNREIFKQWLKADAKVKQFDMDWVEVQYGDDERVTKIIEHAAMHEYGDD